LVTTAFGFDVALTTLDFDSACLRTGAFFAMRYGSCLLGARILLDDARDNNDLPGKKCGGDCRRFVPNARSIANPALETQLEWRTGARAPMQMRRRFNALPRMEGERDSWAAVPCGTLPGGKYTLGGVIMSQYRLLFSAGAAALVGLNGCTAEAPSTAPRVPDLSGVWMAFAVENPAGGGNAAQHSVEGRAALDAFAAGFSSIPETGAWCYGTGMPSVMLSTVSYPIEIVQHASRLVMLAELEMQVRRVYLDGRAHPDDFLPTGVGPRLLPQKNALSPREERASASFLPRRRRASCQSRLPV
jgi:hypothetical protein